MFGKGDIFIHVPMLAQSGQFPVIGTFYRRLPDALRALGFNPIEILGKDKPLRRDRSKKHLIYHTRFRNTGAHANVKIGYLPHFFYVDPQGFSCWSSIRKAEFDPSQVDARAAGQFYEARLALFKSRRLTKVRQNPTIEALPEGAIAIMLQVADDEVMRHAHISSDEMIAQVLAHRAGRPVLIKPHPNCRNAETPMLLDKFISDKEEIFATNAHLHDVFGASEQVVCVNSGTGFEALMHGKPVTLFGRSDYGHVTSNYKEGRDVGRMLQRPPPDFGVIQKFLYWFLAQHQIDVEAQDFDAQIARQLSICGLL